MCSKSMVYIGLTRVFFNKEVNYTTTSHVLYNKVQIHYCLRSLAYRQKGRQGTMI